MIVFEENSDALLELAGRKIGPSGLEEDVVETEVWDASLGSYELSQSTLSMFRDQLQT